MELQKIVDGKCPNCDEELKQLRWFAETEADECGVYVVYIGRCPHCYEEIEYEFGYKTDPDEPLRHEY